MKNALCVALLLSFLCACSTATTTTRDDLLTAYKKHEFETINALIYMGGKDGYHYIKHTRALRSKTYRIAENEFTIANPFPLTKDSKKWKPITLHSNPLEFRIGNNTLKIDADEFRHRATKPSIQTNPDNQPQKR